MTTINNTFKADMENARFPVYCLYEGQSRPQPSYVTLDLRDGELTARYNGEIGGTPSDQWHNLVITFPIPAATSAEKIAQLLEQYADDFQAIFDNSESRWDGNNMRGFMNDTASKIYDKITMSGQSLGAANEEGGMIDLPELIGNQPFPVTGETVAEFIKTIEEEDGQNGYYFNDGDRYKIEERVNDMWADMLYSTDELPCDVAKHLLKAGTCEDQQWVDLLNELANQP